MVNADDFGLSTLTNNAILHVFERRLISSTTIMTNMPGFSHACELIHRYHMNRHVGLHLNFTQGTPLTDPITNCPRFCDSNGQWRPRQMVLYMTPTEARALEIEITAQYMACTQQGFTPTHFDSHHHIHTEIGVLSIVTRMAVRLSVPAIRIARNIGQKRQDASFMHRSLARTYRLTCNGYLRSCGLAKTGYFGDLLSATAILQSARLPVELMVHPRYDAQDRLVDLDGGDLEARIRALRIQPEMMCSYHHL